MKIDKFYKDSIVLTASNLVTGIIGFIFTILLSRKLGPEGLGLYGLIMPIYGLLLCLTSDGLVTALSRIAAVFHNKRDYRNLHRTLSTLISFMLLWSLAIAFLVFINASWIGGNIVKDLRSADAIRVICPALVFVSLSAILKGYFYGLGQFKIAAVIDTLEKILRVAFLAGIVAVLSLSGIKGTVTAAYTALAIGEFTSFSLLFTGYRIFRNRLKSGTAKSQNRLQLLFNVLVISSPLCLNGFISSLLSALSTLLLPRRLMAAGLSYEHALSLIGKFSGMALTITFLPFVIVSSISTVLIPDLSLNTSKNNAFASESRIHQVLKISALVGTATLIICLAIPDTLGVLFYHREDLGDMIRFASLSAFLSFIASPTYGILNGLGRQNITLRNSLFTSLQGLAFVYVLTGIPAINIYGYGITLMATSLTALVLNLHEIRKVCDLSFSIADAIVCCIIGILSFLVLMLMNHMLPDSLLLFKGFSTCLLGFVLVFSMAGWVFEKAY